MMDEEEIKEVSQVMSNLGSISADRDREASGRVRLPDVGHRLADGLLRIHRAAARPLHAAGQGRRNHGGNPRSRRPHHVGQAGQCERERAGQLSEERISPDRFGGAVQDQAGACRARAGRAARGIRAGSGAAHAAHGKRAEGHPRQGRADPAHRVHVQPGAHRQARQP